MKRALFTLLLSSVQLIAACQILLDNSYAGSDIWLDKLHQSGFKYVQADIPNLKIKIYNINHSLFKTINIPAQQLPITAVRYISENLFDNDSQIEYAITTYSGSGLPTPTGNYKFYVYKETGAQIMFRDSGALFANTYLINSVFNNTDPVYFDGVNTKLRVSIMAGNPQGVVKSSEIYTLPGTIPCVQCSSTGTVSGFAKSPGGNTSTESIFYPNPVTDQLKLRYSLPKDYKEAEIRIFDMKGSLIETYKITDTFDFIYLPTSYNNGMYLYSLVVDGIVAKTEKVILAK